MSVRRYSSSRHIKVSLERVHLSTKIFLISTFYKRNKSEILDQLSPLVFIWLLIIANWNNDIWWTHQTVLPTSNSESTNFLTNICYGFRFSWQTEKKLCFGPTRKLFSFSTAPTEKNSWKNSRNKLVKTSDEFVNSWLPQPLPLRMLFWMKKLNSFKTLVPGQKLWSLPES